MLLIRTISVRQIWELLNPLNLSKKKNDSLATYWITFKHAVTSVYGCVETMVIITTSKLKTFLNISGTTEKENKKWSNRRK